MPCIPQIFEWQEAISPLTAICILFIPFAKRSPPDLPILFKSINMTLASVTQASSKTAEFARLFDLFDRVATRRTQALVGNTNNVISADDIANAPPEFASILKNLSTVLTSRALREEQHARRCQATSTNKSRCYTLAGAPFAILETKYPVSRVDVMGGDPESPAFPLGECYPFTFKLMLHKLYNLDEWAEKVKHAVEASKSQFKPLAEGVQDAVEGVAADIREGEGGGKKNSVHPVLGVSAKVKPPSVSKHPNSTAKPPKSETSRVVKKRCVGRRKSISGPMSTGVWVYDAIVAATEATGVRPVAQIAFSMPSDTGGVVKSRVRHRSLTALEEMHGDAAKREVKIAVSLKREVSGSIPPPPSSVPDSEPAQEIVRTEKVVKKRLMVTAIASEPCKTAAVKRPFCI